MIRFKPVEVACNYCGKKRFKKASKLKENPMSFCSQKCFHLYNIKEKIVNCSHCDSPVIKKLCELRKTKKSFCDKECKRKSMITDSIKLKCDYCNLTFFRKAWDIRDIKHHFCSKQCSWEFQKEVKNKTKEAKNKEVLRDISKIISGKIHHGYRSLALKEYGYKCQNESCIITKNEIKIEDCQFEVDHINNDRKDNRLCNLQVLCCYCHAMKTRGANSDK